MSDPLRGDLCFLFIVLDHLTFINLLNIRGSLLLFSCFSKKFFILSDGLRSTDLSKTLTYNTWKISFQNSSNKAKKSPIRSYGNWIDPNQLNKIVLTFLSAPYSSDICSFSPFTARFFLGTFFSLVCRHFVFSKNDIYRWPTFDKEKFHREPNKKLLWLFLFIPRVIS